MTVQEEFATSQPSPPAPEAALRAPAPRSYNRGAFFEDSRVRSPLIAGVLSILPGLGQIYVGYYQQGFLNIVVVGALISFLAADSLQFLTPLAGFFLVFFWLFNIVDAARRAAYYNQALAGLDPAELPRAISLPESQGSLAAGVTLVVLGLIALSHTLFKLPLDWVENWWPAALVLMGGWLVYQSLQAGNKR